MKLQGYENGWTEGSFAWIVNNIYFQYYSLLIFLVSIVVMVVVSYATAAAVRGENRRPDLRHAHRRTSPRIARSWNIADVLASAAVLVAIMAAYIYFSG